MKPEELRKLMEEIPAPPVNSTFSFLELREIYNPHPFCITSRHLEAAHGRYLDERALSKHPCGVKGCNLSYKEHIPEIIGIIGVPDVEGGLKRLSDVDGLQEYLLSIKDKAEQIGVKGFAFYNWNKFFKDMENK